MNSFQVGDRIAVYGPVTKQIGMEAVGSSTFWWVGKVMGVDGDDIEFEFQFNSFRYFAHRKQCRRLVKKERRRVWIRWPDKDTDPLDFPTLVCQVNPPLESGSQWREFIEVRKK